jgi:hypothetical protein
MRHAIGAVGLGLVFAVMGGCYTSKVPLGDSHESKIEPKLLGDWTGQMDSDTVRVVVRQFDDHEYYISFAFNDKPAALTRAYSVTVGGVPFMNMQNIGAVDENDRIFIFARYEVTPDGELVVRLLNKDPLLGDRQFESSEAFRQFVKEHLDEEQLYTKPVHLKRVKGLEMKIEPKSGE